MLRLALIAAAVWSSLLVGLAGQPAPPRPLVTGINHVAFRVTDAGTARRFYGGILGLTEHASTAGPRIRYSVGHRQRVLLEPGLPAGEDERLSHIAFDTPDVRVLTAYLVSRGMKILQPDDRCEGAAVRVTDPDGHTIEFVPGKWPPEAAAGGSERALSNRLLHAGITVRVEQSAHTFYREILGFSEIWRGGRTEGITAWVNMKVADGTDYLEYMLEPPRDRRMRGVLHHICLAVPDIQASWEEVVRRSALLKQPLPGVPQVGTNGRWQLNLYDPDGTRTELMESFTIR